MENHFKQVLDMKKKKKLLGRYLPLNYLLSPQVIPPYKQKIILTLTLMFSLFEWKIFQHPGWKIRGRHYEFPSGYS